MSSRAIQRLALFCWPPRAHELIQDRDREGSLLSKAPGGARDLTCVMRQSCSPALNPMSHACARKLASAFGLKWSILIKTCCRGLGLWTWGRVQPPTTQFSLPSTHGHGPAGHI